jgi:hypothetical protein
MNKDDLIKTSKKLTTVIKLLEKNAETSRDDGKISPEQFLKAKDEWEKLETKALELKGLIDQIELEEITNPDVNSAFSNIINATGKLENAAQKIVNVGNVLTEIANVVDVVTSAIDAIK